MGRALFLILSLFFFLTSACNLLPGSEPAPQAGAPVTTPDAAASPADVGATGKGQKPAPTGTGVAGAPQTAGHPEAGGGATWTILFYMNVGADVEAEALSKLAEMGAAGSSSAVNVLVQIGSNGEGGGARRYRVMDGGQTDAVAELEGVQMAGADALADFITWGRDNYPAARYALSLWDPYGGGWQGVAVGAPERAYLSAAALQAGMAEVTPLDLVALDAGRLGHLEIYHVLEPHARFAVAAPAPLSGRGADYERLLSAIYGEPEVSPADLAGLWARILAAPAEETAALLPATVAAVDLEALPAVTDALESLAGILADAPELSAAAVSDARAAAGLFRALTPADRELAASIDLGIFARRLAQRSPDPAVVRQARVLEQAVAQAVAYAAPDDATGSAAGGIAVYFPASATDFEMAYADIPFLSAWQRFLSAYHATALEGGDRPLVEIVHLAGDVAGIQQPAYLDFELAGRDVTDVAAIAGRSEADGALRLLAYQQKLPGAGFDQYRWRDGIHQGQHVWETEGSYLADGSSGDFVLLWPLAADLHAVVGRLAPVDGDWQEATLVFEGTTGRYVGAWLFRGEARRGSPRTYVPRSGDQFQAYHFYLEEEAGSSVLRSEPELTLTFPEGQMLRLENRPLPGGEYRLGVMAGTDTGRVSALTPLTVNNPEETLPTRAYLDPHYGFQFLYPAAWSTPAYEQAKLLAVDPAGDVRLTVSLYPGSDPGAAGALKAQTLEQFGGVDVLFEEDIFVAGTPGLLTAYGYAAANAGRTGLFFTFVQGDVGYVVDVDGPVAREAETIALVDQFVNSWLFRPLGVGADPGRWTASNGASPVDVMPAGYRFNALNNGWQRFSGEGGFVAFRDEPASGVGREEIVARWLAIAGGEVASFSPEPISTLTLAGNRWARADFTYEGDSGPVRGYVMATLQGGQEVVAWAEAAADAFATLEADVYQAFIAEYLSGRPGEAGLVYEATFDTVGAFGTGSLEGATARVVDGAYQLNVAADEGFFWASAGKQFGNATYEITATHTAGPADNGYGLLLRADNETGAFYLLEISGDGYAWVGRCHDSCAQVVSLAEGGWFPAPSVRVGLDAANRLSVEADGERLTFFVNDRPVAKVTDGLLANGDVGFFVETLGEGGVTVAFSRLRVLGH